MEIDFNLVNEFKETILKSYNEALNLDKNVRNKELNDIVTYVDIYMETKIIEKIQELFPEHSIYAEEKGEILEKSEYVWYIDPIDGTINFANGIPLYSTSIALKKNNETIFGFIYDYSSEKCYYAIKGKGAYCNQEKLSVSNNNNLSDSIISFCLTSHYNLDRVNEVLEIEKCLAPRVRGLRLFVSSAIELAWCAEGKIDGCINIKKSQRISSSAGILLIEEAGGKVTNIQGNTRQKVDTMLATNGLIHSKVVNALKYAVFIGSSTEVIEIKQDELNSTINTYIAGKAYSQAIAGAKAGLNSKLLTTISGVRKNELDSMILEAKKNNIDTSNIVISNSIENDIKIVFKDENNIKIKEEDILKGSAEALSEEIIIQNKEVLKKASIIVCQTKISKKTINKIVEIANENNVPVVINPSRPNEISLDNKENEELFNKISMIICDTKQLKEIFEQNVMVDEVLKKYGNKLIVMEDNNQIKYFDGNSIISINSQIELQEVGAKDIFIGRFVKNYLEKENITEAIKASVIL